MLTIREAQITDADKLIEIYAPYVKNTAITFEYDVPSVSEFAHRISSTVEKYPYIVAEIDGKAAGYAYAGEFHARPAYNWAVETSIYVAENMRGIGIGKILHNELGKLLHAMGILNMEACIAYTPVEDSHLTNASVGFHTSMGYRMVGRFYQCGYKFFHWYDMVWMEKHIGEHVDHQPDIIPFCNVKNALLPVTYDIKLDNVSNG